jgi:hypothetical protein
LNWPQRCTRIEQTAANGYLHIAFMNSSEQVQRFKASSRKALARQRLAGRGKTRPFSLARANKIKSQPLNVSAVEVLEHEINPDYWT